MRLTEANSREDAWRLLEGFAWEGRESLERQRSRKPLVKSYILETVPPDQPTPNLLALFQGRHATLTQIDQDLYRVDSPQGDDAWGFLETFQRHPVLYTPRETQEMDPWVKKLIQDSKELDNLWLSGRAFQSLLDTVFATRPPHRFGRLVFEHHSIFEDGVFEESLPEDEMEMAVGEPVPDEDPDSEFIPEQRSTKFSVMDRLSNLQEKLGQLQNLYAPLYSISQLRFPAHRRGGHDFYHWGKATNRSDSFVDHRQHVEYVLDVYRAATERAEARLWGSVEKNVVRTLGETHVVLGAPVFFKFDNELSQETFDRFVIRVFRRRANEFRLWGNPIKLGPRKVHVYGLDRHLWQPIHLEITHRGMTAIVPRGTCGNSIHRLVTNIQQYLDPKVQVFIGDTSYEEILKNPIEGVSAP